MKKSLLIIAVAGLAFASCKKDYTCTCKDSTGSGSADIVLPYKNVKKSDATDACNAANTLYTGSYSCSLNS